MEDRKLPLLAFNHYLDESDPDVLILRRQDDSFVAAFSAIGATREGIVEAAKEDFGSSPGLMQPGRARVSRGSGATRATKPGTCLINRNT
jgi:hypothetical protein